MTHGTNDDRGTVFVVKNSGSLQMAFRLLRSHSLSSIEINVSLVAENEALIATWLEPATTVAGDSLSINQIVEEVRTYL
jgi:hypothetical protein